MSQSQQPPLATAEAPESSREAAVHAASAVAVAAAAASFATEFEGDGILAAGGGADFDSLAFQKAFEEAATISSGTESGVTYAPSPASIPKTITKSYQIFVEEGETEKIETVVPTHIFLQLFADRIVVGISQLDGAKIGNWMLCEAARDPLRMLSSSSSNNSSSAVCADYQLSHLLGCSRDDPSHGVYARQICDRILQLHPTMTGLSLLLGLSLRTTKQPSTKLRADPDMFHTIVGLVLDMYVEATTGRPIE